MDFINDFNSSSKKSKQENKQKITEKLLCINDTDYTQVLPSEAEAINKALKDFEKGFNICDDSTIDW